MLRATQLRQTSSIKNLTLVYNIIIYIYLLGVAVASFFSTKVRKMWRGERDAFDVLRNNVEEGAQYVWFHAASLGEFEQGRPLIEELRHTHPQYKVLLTFFSPSGYEVRKNYEGADIVCYLPLDTPLNARRFLRQVRPVMAFFIKYEFWYNYLHILKHRGVPTYSVSSIFRPDQIFFRWYGKSYGKVLACFSHFFVQNEQSRSLLATIGIRNVSVTGDTRFDRVLQIQKASKHLPLIENFVQGKHLFVAGSSWPSDEEIFVPFFNARSDWKMIIAPHVVSEEHLQQLEQQVEGQTIRYSKATPESVAEADCLLIDCYGLLSSVYHYADVTYVGGGFGVGIHNVLEAAVWGVPVIFGPNNQRFQEAQDLMVAGGGFEVDCKAHFDALMDEFIEAPWRVQVAGEKSTEYVKSQVGATDKVLEKVFLK